MSVSPLPSLCADSLAGTARLRVVAVAVGLSFLCASLLEYALPLYFPAKGLPASAWETWCLRTIFAWMLGPIFAAVITQRLGERRAWALGLLGYVPLPFMLLALPSAGPWSRWLLDIASWWYGGVAALIWIGGISLAQIVPPRRKSLANAATMTAVALGAAVAPQIGRWLLVTVMGHHHDQGTARDFLPLFALYGVLAAVGAVLVYCWGQRAPGEECAGLVHQPAASLRDSLGLLRSRRFLATVLALGLLTGPVFQATNVYRAYRAAEPQIGLIVAAQDHGFAFLQSSGYVGQLLGGLLIGLLAGRQANRVTGALILGSFTLCQLGIGLAPQAWMLILASGLFEMLRQLVRWSQTGFMSEQVPEQHRATAISVTILLSGLGGWLLMVVTRALQTPGDPDFSTSLPFYLAALSGVAGVTLLLVTHQAVGGKHTAPSRKDR